MIIPDLNLLLYAYNPHMPQHDRARRWFMNLMAAAMAAGPVLSDAILAAYAIEHRATLCTNDGDFARFPALSWENPLLGA